MGCVTTVLAGAGAVVVASALLAGDLGAVEPVPAAIRASIAQPAKAVAPSLPFNDPQFVLLKLDGSRVKWGAPRLGTGAVVRYAFVTSETERGADAINCRAMVPIHGALPNAPLGAADFVAGVRRAMDAWSAAADVHFVLADDPARADLLIGGQKVARGIAFTDVERDPHAIGSVAPIAHAAICFNLTLPWEARMDGDRTTPDVAYVAAHELGHVLGLDHAWGQDKIMRFQYEELFDTPQPADLAGAVDLYGPARPLAPQLATVPLRAVR